jgi:hypothetical protein
MKLVVLMYLEDDGANVEKLLQAHQVAAYSELPVTGHGLGTAGWYGTVAPYKSRMLIALMTATKAAELVAAVDRCTGCSDPNHPIHAWTLAVEQAVASGPPITSSES